MNYGAQRNTSNVVVFLHFDTCLPNNWFELIKESVREGALWGRFDIRLDASGFMFRVIEKFMNYRTALTNIATGDQTIFVRSDVFNLVGGYPEISLMEDIAFTANLRIISSAKCIKHPVVTSARRWKKNGVLRTVFLMWSFRLAYWLGISPERLAHWYK
jgi:rSAM/selenodomain-associated transferase 2